MNESKEEALFRKDLTNAIRESNETFARSLNQISSPMSTVTQCLARSFEFMSQTMFSNNNQQRHYPSNLSIYQNSFSVIINKINRYITILTVNLTGTQLGREWGEASPALF